MNISDSELEDIYGKLYAFTHFILKQHDWFRKDVTDSFLKGQTVDDYVSEAITRYLEYPEKYDASKSSLISYLKHHVIRTLVGNDARSKENVLSEDLLFQATADDAEPFQSVEAWIPYADSIFDEEIDYKAIIYEIRRAVEQDSEATIIFESICISQQTRRQIIEEQNWTPDIFDNAMKRLKRVLIGIGKQYRLTE